MTRPIFFDPTGRRGVLAKRSVAFLILVIVLGAIAFATTLVMVPRQRELELPQPRYAAASLHRSRGLQGRKAWLPRLHHPANTTSLSIGFYQPGSDGSFFSLSRHADQLDWVVPAQINITGADKSITIADDRRFDAFAARSHHRFRILPMVQNVSADGWDGEGIAQLLATPVRRAALVRQLADYSAKHGSAGLVVDFENLPENAMPTYLHFLHDLHAALPADAQLAVTAPAGDPAWPLEALARATDKVIVMAY
ncbi:MAG: polysaccharide deacetylase, partial [Novosphingobium sp.]